MGESDLEARISELERRVANLERKGEENQTSIIVQGKAISKDKSTRHKGVTGGIIFLIDEGFFKILRSSREIYEELKKEGYFYRLEAVDTILRRDFVARKKILSRTKDGKIWKYGLRK